MPVETPVVEEAPVLIRNTTIFNALSNIGNVSQNYPEWNTPGRPKDPREGTIGFNFQTEHLEIRLKSKWLKIKMKKIK